MTVWPLSTTVRRSPFIVISKRFQRPSLASARTFGVTPARTAAGMLEVQKTFRRLKAYRQLPILRKALQDHHRKAQANSAIDLTGIWDYARRQRPLAIGAPAR